MIQAFALQAIRQAALSAGLPENRVIPTPVADNLTLPRPRLEYQVLPARYRRTGKKIALTKGTKDAPVQTTTWELYAVDLDIQVNVLAEDTKKDDALAEAWLATFTQNFITALPRGGNDASGNYARLRVQRAAYARKPDPRVGDTAFRVFTKIGSTFVITVSGRVTSNHLENLMTSATINLPTIGKRESYGYEKDGKI